MKTCKIYGDLTADRADDIYPTVQFCDACAKRDNERGEGNAIVEVLGYDPSYGDECDNCKKTLEEEMEELGR